MPGKEGRFALSYYALAICMYEMLDGKPPFTSDNPVGLMYKHVNQQPRELRLQNGKPIHPAISKFILKGLEKDPNLRFQTAAKMDEALSKLAEHFEGEIPSGMASARSSAPTITLVLLCMLIMCIVVFLRQGNKSPIPVQDKTTPFHAASLDKQRMDKTRERECQGALASADKIYGPYHIKVTESLDDPAALYEQQNKFAEAGALYKRSLAIREKAFGPNDPMVDRGLNRRAFCYNKQGKYAEAEALLKRALQIQEKACGPDHPNVARSLENYAKLLRESNRAAEAGSTSQSH